MKFVIGDKVKVRKDLKNGHCGIDNLEDYQNDKVFTIEQGIGNVYNLLEDKAGYYFSEEMLILVEEKIILKAIKNKQGIYEMELPKNLVFVGSRTELDNIRILEFKEKEEILDIEEKEYLGNLIKPFRNRVCFIKKIGGYTTKQYITIVLKDENIEMPYFKANSMYKGMEQNKEYTLEELGL